jgi:hypothetical protein
MTNTEILKRIKYIKEVKPDKAWVASNRADLLLRIRESQPVAQQPKWKEVLETIKTNFGFALDIILPHRFIMAFGRPAVISIVGALILVSGMSAVGASQGTIPGDILYPVKIASETVQLSFTSSVENKTRLEIEFAGRRIGELNKLAAADKLTPSQLEEKVNKVTSRLRENIDTVNTHLAVLNQEDDAKKALEVAKIVDKKVAEYILALNKISDTPVAKAKVNEALSQVEEASDKALAVMVSKHNKVENGISDLEIVEKLNNKIAAVSTVIEEVDADNLANDTEAVDKVVKEAQELVRQGDFVAALSKISEGKDIVKEIRERMNVEDNSQGDDVEDEPEVPEVGEQNIKTEKENREGESEVEVANSETDTEDAIKESDKEYDIKFK